MSDDQAGIGVILSMLALLMLAGMFMLDVGLTYEETVVLMLLNIGSLIADK